MGLLDWLKKSDESAEEDYRAELALETSKVRAYRTADEVVTAANNLMKKVLELRTEIEAMKHE